MGGGGGARSLGPAIGLMMWMWLSIIVILVGAELNSEIEHQTARDRGRPSHPGEPERLEVRPESQ
jgi:membrane protein